MRQSSMGRQWQHSPTASNITRPSRTRLQAVAAFRGFCPVSAPASNKDNEQRRGKTSSRPRHRDQSGPTCEEPQHSAEKHASACSPAIACWSIALKRRRCLNNLKSRSVEAANVQQLQIPVAATLPYPSRVRPIDFRGGSFWRRSAATSMGRGGS